MAKNKILDIYICLASIAILLLALEIVAGWHLERPSMVQLRPGMVPMQHNTALTFLLLGAALLASRGTGVWINISAVAGGLVFILAALTGLQYLLGRNFGIDTMFIDPSMVQAPDLQVKTAHPGRMAPNTVICFILLAGALIARSTAKNAAAKLNTAFILSALVVTMSVSALAGYVFHIEAAYGWWSLSDISPQAAAGFFLAGTAGMAMVFAEPAAANLFLGWNTFRKPLIAAVIGMIVTLAIAQGVLEQGRLRIEGMTRSEAKRIADVVARDLMAATNAMLRMQARWEMHDGTPIGEWRANTLLHVKHNTSYMGQVLMRPDLTVYETIAPPDDPDFWSGAIFDREALAKAAAENAPLVARLNKDGKKLPVLLYYMPLKKQGASDGFMVTAYNLQRGLNDFLDLGTNYQYAIYDEDGLLVSSAEQVGPHPWAAKYEQIIGSYGRQLRVEVVQDVTGYENGWLVFLVFMTGVITSLMLAVSLQKTERIREYAEELKVKDDLYTLAVEGAGVALWDWDIRQGRVEWAGQAWKFFGVGSNEEVSRDEAVIRALFPPDDDKAIDEIILRDFAKGDTFVVEFRIRQPDGRHIWVQARGKAVERDASGQPIRSVGIYADISDLKNYETEMKRTNEELEQFAYIASHDLKAPLRGIDNLAKWIEEDLGDAVTPDAREKLDLMRGRITRLESLLEDILQYSRAGRIVDDPVEINTKEMIGQIVESMVLPETFKVSVADGLPVLVSSYTPLQQVFLNLISNAFKHHDHKEGTIAVSVKDAGGYYEFSVADDGPGIPEEFHERVFKMFQTLQSRDKKEGSGLGMSIVKKLVEWQGGKAWIVSKTGQRGTAVHFLWPKRFANPRRADAA